jgi:hypothetical protein
MKDYAPRLIPEQARLPVAFQKQGKTKANKEKQVFYFFNLGFYSFFLGFLCF